MNNLIQYVKNLPQPEQDSIYNYTTEDFDRINYYLNKGGSLPDEMLADIKNIDKAFKLAPKLSNHSQFTEQ